MFVNPRTRRPWKNPEKLFRGARQRAGLPWLTVHILRHYRITEWVRAGVDLRTVQELAGHSNINTTLRYAHFVPAAYDQVRQLMDRPVARSVE